MNENLLLFELKTGDQRAFAQLFRKYYKDLVLFGGIYLDDKVRCEDIVQTIFLKLWADREKLVIETSLKSFLLKSVRNACLDEWRHKQITREHKNYWEIYGETDNSDTEHYILYSDLHTHLTKALDKLPEVYREAFEMNRFKGLKYKEIASHLEVSERTVEVRIGKAIALLREHLKEFIISLIVFLFS